MIDDKKRADALKIADRSLSVRNMNFSCFSNLHFHSFHSFHSMTYDFDDRSVETELEAPGSSNWITGHAQSSARTRFRVRIVL